MTSLAYSRFTWSTLLNVVEVAEQYGADSACLVCTSALRIELRAAIAEQFPKAFSVTYHGAVEGEGLIIRGMHIELSINDDLITDGVVSVNGRKILDLFRFSQN